MKHLLLVAILSITAFNVKAQTSVSTTSTNLKIPALDKSPMDVSHFPVDYPVLKIKSKTVEPLIARILYSRPQKVNREVFGELVEFNKIWRLGANEATEIEFFKDVKFNEKKLSKGRYSLFAIPTPSQWTLIFNRETDVWGAFKYDEKKDVLRVDVPVEKNTSVVEAFTMTFENGNAESGRLIIAWDDVLVNAPFVVLPDAPTPVQKATPKTTGRKKG